MVVKVAHTIKSTDVCFNHICDILFYFFAG